MTGKASRVGCKVQVLKGKKGERVKGVKESMCQRVPMVYVSKGSKFKGCRVKS